MDTEVLRSTLAGTEAFHRQVQQAVWSVDANLPITWLRTLRDIYDQSSELHIVAALRRAAD